MDPTDPEEVTWRGSSLALEKCIECVIAQSIHTIFYRYRVLEMVHLVARLPLQ